MGVTLGELSTAPRGAEARDATAVDVVVAVLLYLEGFLLKGSCRAVCSLLGQARVNEGAAEAPQPGPRAQTHRSGAEVVVVGLTWGSCELWLFLSLQADALGGAVEV